MRQVGSVLGGNYSPAWDYSGNQAAQRLTIAVALAVQFLDAFLFAIALVFTAILVSVILRGERPVFPASAGRLRGHLKRILSYSTKIWLVGLVLYLALEWPFYLPESTTHLPGLSHPAMSALTLAARLIHGCCYGWIMAHLAIPLLQLERRVSLPVADMKLARNLSMLVAVVDELIRHFAYLHLSAPGPHASVANDAAYYLTGPFATLPYVFLYVAFALIADPDLKDRVVPDSLISKWLRSAMPLHFGPGNEP
jgi:hypothetical protein